MNLSSVEALTEGPMLVRIYRIGKTRSHEQVAPVSIGKLYRAARSFSMLPSLNLSAAKRTRSSP